jgi:predicted PurR-regulated permease PerM
MGPSDESRRQMEARVAPAMAPNGSLADTAILCAIVVGALYFAQEVLIPIALAILLSFVLAPAVRRLRHLNVPKVPAVILSVLLALGIVLGLGSVIGAQVASLATELPRYQTTIQEKVTSIRQLTFDRVAGFVTSVTRQLERKQPPDQAEPAPQAAPGNAAPAERPIPVEVAQQAPTPIELVKQFLTPLIHPLATIGIVFIVSVFMLMQQEDLRDRMIRLFGSNDLHRTTAALDDAAKRLSRYFLLQLSMNAAFGVAIAIGLWIIGVPSPILWGVLAALMRFVPYVGAFISGALPVALAAAVDPNWTTALWTVALFAASETTMGQVIEPLAYGHSTGLSPTAVIISAIFWTWLWGAIGLILATPLTLCLVVLGRYVERLEFLDVLLGDRPALTPAENFYQRILAGDPDEALDYAERLLKERSLSSYFDEVALRGLQYAANDLERGVLDRRQLENVRTAIASVIRDLESYEDVEPKSEKDDDAEAAPEAPGHDGTRPPLAKAVKQEGRILCVAGRGPLDEAASEMLALLLRKHGLASEVAPHDAVSRDAIGGLDLSDVRMVCISYLEIRGNPAHLRYLLRRLKRRAPDTPILVGLWPADDAILTNRDLRREVGADFYTASLREAVEIAMSVMTSEDSEGDEGSEPPVAAKAVG